MEYHDRIETKFRHGNHAETVRGPNRAEGDRNFDGISLEDLRQHLGVDRANLFARRGANQAPHPFDHGRVLADGIDGSHATKDRHLAERTQRQDSVVEADEQVGVNVGRGLGVRRSVRASAGRGQRSVNRARAETDTDGGGNNPRFGLVADLLDAGQSERRFVRILRAEVGDFALVHQEATAVFNRGERLNVGRLDGPGHGAGGCPACGGTSTSDSQHPVAGAGLGCHGYRWQHLVGNVAGKIRRQGCEILPDND